MTAPRTFMEALWPVVGPALTPELVGAVLVTLMATHAVKMLAEYRYPRVTESAPRWRAFCVSTSISIGALAGLVTWWLTAATWPIVPIVALGSGPAWRILQVLPGIRRVSDVFLTPTDRRYRRKEAP